jgi:hypothetical protein
MRCVQLLFYATSQLSRLVWSAGLHSHLVFSQPQDR